MIRSLYLCGWAALVITVAVGCSSAPVDVEALPRTLPPNSTATPDFGPALVFGPGAVWITGIEGDSWSVGSFVAAGPAPTWPAGIEAPTLVVGRIIERHPTWARLELLAATDTIRPEALTPRVVDALELPSITKRLLPVLPSGGDLHAPAGTSDLVTGAELYGVISPQGLARPGRFGRNIDGLARLIPLEPDTSRIEGVMGRPPQPGDRLVFLGPRPADPLDIQISVAPLGDGADGLRRRDAVVAAVELELQRLGASGVRVEVLETPLSGSEVLQRLGSAARERLEIVAFVDEEDVVIGSQIERVETRGTIPWRQRPWRSGLSTELALALVVHAHQLRGERVVAAWLMEDLLRVGNSPTSRWLDYGPSLAEAYAAIWRSDWSLEVRLLLEQLVDEVDERHRGRAREAVLLTALAHRHPRDLDAVVESLQLHVESGGEVSERTLEALISWYNRRRRWNEADRWRTILGRQHDASVLKDAWHLTRLDLQTAMERGEPVEAEVWGEALHTAESIGPFAVAHVDALQAMADLQASGALPDNYLEVVAQVDAAGVPALGYTMLTQAAAITATSSPETTDKLLREAAWFAQAARQPLDFAAVLGELESWRLDQGVGPLDGKLAVLYVEALATSDRRLQLGRRALAAAQSAPDATSTTDLLDVAYELFLSIGDPMNIAIVEFRRVRLEISRGRPEVAQQHLELGSPFVEVSQDPALSALRNSLQRELTP